jgi:catechol 2,3-dioxygenase-like lactoylglutathione lyase family enzyme
VAWQSALRLRHVMQSVRAPETLVGAGAGDGRCGSCAAADASGGVMAERPSMRLSGIVLDAPDARALASFYRRLLGWTVGTDEPNWATLRSPDGGAGLSFQTEQVYVRPIWPSTTDHQQMMAHLDIEVDDLEAAGAHAVQAGAVLAEFQPQELVRVYLDPAGHPFCLWVRGT